MSTGNHDFPNHGSGQDGPDQIAELLRRVEPRPPLPDSRKLRVRDAVRTEWMQKLRTRRRRQMFVLSGSLAAILAVAILLTPIAREQISIYLEPPFQGEVGEVAVVRGLAWYAAQDTPEQFPGRRLVLEDVLEAGDKVETTGDSRVALTLLDGRSLRLDRNTRIRFIDPTTLELQSGTLYVDSEEALDLQEPVEIQTALGSVYDVGTQFEVRFADESLRVRVREGAINLDREGEVIEALAGVELSVDAAGLVSRRQVKTRGPLWDWILDVAPAFALEGSSLPSFLAWVSRETGRDIRYLDGDTAESSAAIIVHGSVEGLRPDEALDAVLPTCGLAYRSVGDSWVLEDQL